MRGAPSRWPKSERIAPNAGTDLQVAIAAAGLVTPAHGARRPRRSRLPSKRAVRDQDGAAAAARIVDQVTSAGYSTRG